MTTVADAVDEAINQAIKKFDGKVELDNPFENLVGLAEVIDRLCITNYKLFRLKDEVVQRQDAVKYLPESEKMVADTFCSWASVEDVRLCKERSRLKNCLDTKVAAMIGRVIAGDSSAGSNPETKMYGSVAQ